MTLQSRLSDLLEAFLESLRAYADHLHPDHRDSAMPYKVQFVAGRTPPVKLIRNHLPGQESNHAGLSLRAQEARIAEAAHAIVREIRTAAPYYDTPGYEFTFETFGKCLEIRVLIDGMGAHIGALPPGESAEILASILAWLGHLRPGSRLYDVKGQRIRAESPQQALAIYCASIQPSNPLGLLGREGTTVLERHQGIHLDADFFAHQV